VRNFLSKCIAGGLSAGVVLLWWPVLFDEADSVTSWLVRGAAWTVFLEVLLLALVPFERALWETARGERISSRVDATASRLHSGSRRRRMGRLSAVAAVTLAASGGLLAMGLQEHGPARAVAKPVRPIKVVRVTKVVNVKRVVRQSPASPAPVVAAPAPQPSAPAPGARTRTAAPTGEVVVGRTAPVQRKDSSAARPEIAPQPAPAEQEDAASGSGAAPASGSSTL
jgi:hypothetical protein